MPDYERLSNLMFFWCRQWSTDHDAVLYGAYVGHSRALPKWPSTYLYFVRDDVAHVTFPILLASDSCSYAQRSCT